MDALFLPFDKLKVPSQVEGLKASGRSNMSVEMALSLSKGQSMTAWFYILRLQSGNLYIGATKSLEKRYEDHNSGTAGRTTSLDPPVSLAYY